MNKAILMGRLAADPELKQTGNGISVTRFTIAVDRRINKEEHQTDWIDCVAWRGTAEFICKYYQKGSSILLEGSLQTRNWEKDGQKHKNVEVKVDSVFFLPRDKTATADNVASINHPTEQKEVYGVQSFAQGGNDDFQQVNDEDLPF